MGDSPWVWWRLRTLVTGMEPCRESSRRASRLRVGTRMRRRPPRCGWSGPCGRSWGSEHDTVKRVAEQLGYGVESVRLWVHQADIDDGHEPGMSTAEAARVRELEQEVRELCRANEILKRAASFFGAEQLLYRPGPLALGEGAPARGADSAVGVVVGGQLPRLRGAQAVEGRPPGRRGYRSRPVARLMRAAGIEGVRRTKRVRTTRADPVAARHPDLAGRRFQADAPNQLWVTDLTYVPTWAGICSGSPATDRGGDGGAPRRQ